MMMVNFKVIPNTCNQVELHCMVDIGHHSPTCVHDHIHLIY